MKNITSSLRIILTLLALLTLLTSPVLAKTKLVVWGMESGEETKGQDAMIAAFEQRNPDIDVVSLSMGAGSMNPQKLMTAIVGGVPPDLVLQDRFSVGDWASRGTFRPLDDLIAGDAKRKDEFAVHKSNYVPAAWNEATYHGKQYAIPWGIDIRPLYYNRAMFRKAGLDPDKPPQTWDELIADAKKLTVHSPSGYQSIGFIPAYKQGWLYLWSWQEDGEFMSPDGRTCTMANPQTEKALKTIVDWYDQLGGVDAINSYAGGFADDATDAFMTGRLAMRVDGDWFLGGIARYHPEMDFGVCPVPVPAERLHHEGRFKNDPTWVTWAGGYGFVIPVGSKHVDASWKFIQWMNSPTANLIGAQAQSAYVRSKGRLFVPRLSADNRVTQALFDNYVTKLPPAFVRAERQIMGLLPYTKYRPVTFVGQRLWDEHVRAVDQAIRHEKSPHAALMSAQTRVLIELNRVYNAGNHPLLPLRDIGIIAAIATIGLFAGLAIGWMRWARRHRKHTRGEALAGLGFIAPWIIGFTIFTLGPIVASFILSFCDYDVLHAPRFAGFDNYRTLFTLDRDYLAKSMGNALYLAAVGIPLGMVTSLAMAMLLNTKVAGQKFYRTCFYMPSIVPIVATAVLWGWMLNADPSRGIVNAGWQSTITAWFHIAPPGWLAVPAWAKPGLILIGLWGAGGGMILWLAGLQSIPGTLYEAASLDGAGPIAQFRHVTLPMLSPYIFFSLIMGTIGALQTFETAYILGGTGDGQTTGPDDSLLVPVVYLFNNAFQYFKMGYASALAWILFIIILGLTLGQLKLAPRWVHYETENT
jgi:multiple sugar transport system permease protein